MDQEQLIKYAKNAACLYSLYCLYKGQAKGMQRYAMIALVAYCAYEEYKNRQEGFVDRDQIIQYSKYAMAAYAANELYKGKVQGNKKMLLMGVLGYVAYEEYQKRM